MTEDSPFKKEAIARAATNIGIAAATSTDYENINQSFIPIEGNILLTWDSATYTPKKSNMKNLKK